MPSSSAHVDPGTLGHPVALTRGPEDGPASESANGSAVEETHTSEDATQEKTARTAGGFFSVPDFTHAAEAREEEVVSPSEAGPGAAIDSVQEPAA
jgi:hypothetical protein